MENNNKSNDTPWMIICIMVLVVVLFGASFYMGKNYGINEFGKDNEADIKNYMSEWDTNLERIVSELEYLNNKVDNLESKLYELEMKIDIIEERKQVQEAEEPAVAEE